MVHVIGIPRLEDIELAFVGPLEGFIWEEPEGGPDSGRAWRGSYSDETAPLFGERGVRCQSRGCVLAVRGDGADDELVIGCMEGVFGRGDVVLEFVVAPAVGAELVLEVVRDGG